MNKIIFDIETSGVDWEDLDAEQQRYLLKFAKTDEDVEQVKQQLALHALTAEIVCIGMLNPQTNKGAVYYRDNKEESAFASISTNSVSTNIATKEMFSTDRSATADKKKFFNEDIFYVAGSEKEILERFWASMRHYYQFITFNGRSFDCPFLLIRSAILGVRATKNLMPPRYSSGVHIDLLEQLNFYSATRKFSLDFYCKAFGIDSPKSYGMNGHDVPDYFRQGRTLEIAEYCVGDLVATKELYERWERNIRF